MKLKAGILAFFWAGTLFGGTAVEFQTLLRISDAQYAKIFNRSHIFSGNEATFSELYASAKKQFELYRSELRASWNLEGQVLEAAFYVNVVNNLWGYGDFRQPDGTYISPACVDTNRFVKEPEGKVLPPNIFPVILKLYPQTYLKSMLACCNDYAMLLYIFLNQAGIAATQLGFSGHVYLQANLDGTEYILEPTFNFMTAQTNEQFLNQPQDKEVVYLIFPFSQADPAETFVFRERASVRRMRYLLSQGRTVISPPVSYNILNQFDKWMKQNYVQLWTGREPIPNWYTEFRRD